MDWYDKFKRFLGIPTHQENLPFDRDRHSPQTPDNHEEFTSPFHGGPGRSFSVFTDPLEIHKYFEQQMSEMLRSFGFQEFGNTFDHQFDFPQIEDPQIEEIPDTGDLREQFLKPGYQKAYTKDEFPKQDADIDGKLDIKDWGSVFKGQNSVTPYQREVVPKNHFYGQSVTSRTIRNSDGSLETHHTVRDNQGNEETTITQKIGDKEYSITKRRDKDGKEETIENLVNLDEKEVDKFFPKLQDLPEVDQPAPHWPLFDRFFR